MRELVNRSPCVAASLRGLAGAVVLLLVAAIVPCSGAAHQARPKPPAARASHPGDHVGSKKKPGVATLPTREHHTQQRRGLVITRAVHQGPASKQGGASPRR
jgi:hypothetical protein